MRFTRKHLCDLPSCYAVGSVNVEGRTLLLFAPDAPGPCYAFDSGTFERETAWEEPGGTMSLVPVPDGSGDFLAVQRFFPGFHAQGTEIVRLSRKTGNWTPSPLLRLPYLHRFDILQRGGVYYLLCCTLCTEKKNEDDWSSPGGLYAAELTPDFTGLSPLVQIAGEMTRNHGYCRVNQNGYTSALTSCDQGVFDVQPPERKGGAWTVRKVLEKPVSDITLCDIDGDGIEELACIEPFHGDHFTVYRNVDGRYEPCYEYPGEMSFGHAIWGGSLRGENVFICGCRGGGRDLFMLRWNGRELLAETLETGRGTSNVHVVPGKDHDLLLMANRESGEAAVFIVTGD